MVPYKITRAKIEDAALVSSLICALLKDFNEKSKTNFVVDTDQVTKTAEQLLARENFGGFLATNLQSNEVVGLITISQGTAIYNGGDFGVITELYVDKNERSNGLGYSLVNQALKFAKTQNWSKVEVGSPNEKEWPITVSFYKKNGFTEKGIKLRISI